MPASTRESRRPFRNARLDFPTASASALPIAERLAIRLQPARATPARKSPDDRGKVRNRASSRFRDYDSLTATGGDMRTGLAAMIVATVATPLAGMFVRVDVENVPVDRVTANLEQQVAAKPTDVKLVINLARVHAMAYAEKSNTLPIGRIAGSKTTE